MAVYIVLRVMYSEYNLYDREMIPMFNFVVDRKKSDGNRTVKSRNNVIISWRGDTINVK